MQIPENSERMVRLLACLVFLIFSQPVLCLADSEQIIDEIIVVGNSRIGDAAILRELVSCPGEPINFIELQQDEKRLMDTQLFRYVEILAQPSPSNSTNLIVYVDEKIPWSPFPLILVTQMDGWSPGGGLEYKGLFGRNAKLGTYAVFGGMDYVMLKYTDPWIAGDRISLVVESSRIERDNGYLNYHQIQYSGGIEIGKEFVRDVSTRMKFGFRMEQADSAGITRMSEREDRIPFVQLQMLVDKRDLYSNPSKGWRTNAIFGQHGLPGEEVDYRFVQLMAAQYLPLGWLGRTLALGVQYAGKYGPMGHYDRYFLGGTETVRGLPMNSDQGSQMLLAMTEYRVDLVRSIPMHDGADLGIGAILFCETGAVWYQEDDWTKQKYHTSWGAGLRFFVPIVEVVRIDYGWTLDGDSSIAVAALAKF